MNSNCKEQTGIKCRACNIMFIDDGITIFCGSEGCSGVEKPQVDKQKLREWLEEEIEEIKEEISWPHFANAHFLDAYKNIIEKLDAGDFDAET